MSSKSVQVIGGPNREHAYVTDTGNRLKVEAAQAPGEAVLVGLGDTPSIGAFDRLRVANPTTLFDSVLTCDKQPLLWNEKLVGGGTSTHLTDESAVSMAVASLGDKVIRQSKQYHRYQPGKSQLQFTTWAMGDGDANVRRRVGYFDGEDGIFLEEIDGALWLVRRTSTSGVPTDNRVAQADWNLDTFNTLDPTKTQILVIDFEWLGVGRVRVGFVQNGIIVYAHEFLNDNILTSVYMRTATLPTRLEIEATGAPSASRSFKAICATVISEGGQGDAFGFPFSANSLTTVSISGADTPILSVRPKLLYNGRANRVGQIIRSMNILNGGNGTALFKIFYNPVLAGASWVSVDASSTMEYDVSAVSLTGGILVGSFWLSATNQARPSESFNPIARLPMALDIDGNNPDVLTLAASNIGTVTAAASLNWQEYR